MQSVEDNLFSRTILEGKSAFQTTVIVCTVGTVDFCSAYSNEIRKLRLLDNKRLILSAFLFYAASPELMVFTTFPYTIRKPISRRFENFFRC